MPRLSIMTNRSDRAEILSVILNFLDHLTLKDIIFIGLLAGIFTVNATIFYMVKNDRYPFIYDENQVTSIESGCFLTVEKDNHYLFLPLGYNDRQGNNLVLLFLSDDNERLAAQNFKDQCDVLRGVARQIQLSDVLENLQNR